MTTHQLSPRVDSLLKSPYRILDDPWRDSFPSLNSFLSTGRNPDKSLNVFHFFMKVSTFKPCEIDVKLEDGFVVIRAKQEEEGFASREFMRQYKLPDDISPASLHSTFENGLLKVKVNKALDDEDGKDGQHFPNLQSLKLTEASETK